MDAKTFIGFLDQLAKNIKESLESSKSIIQVRDEMYELLDKNFEIYINAQTEDRIKIRETIKRQHINNDSAGLFEQFLFGYIHRAIEKLKLTGHNTWLLRGLVVCSIEDSIRDQRDNTFYLSWLYVAAEEKNLNPKPEFQALAEISNNEIPYGGALSTSDLMKKIPDIAHETYNNWIKYR